MWCDVEDIEVGSAELVNDPQLGWIHLTSAPHTLLGTLVEKKNDTWVTVPTEVPVPPAIITQL